jgi:hypothetical protein
MFLIAIPKDDVALLPQGVTVRINSAARTLYRKDGCLTWTDDAGEQVRPILRETDAGALVNFVCGDFPGQKTTKDGLSIWVE